MGRPLSIPAGKRPRLVLSMHAGAVTIAEATRRPAQASVGLGTNVPIPAEGPTHTWVLSW